MMLDRNPENFFAEIGQAAFSPGNTVPGIGLSPDKMLLGRAFAYNDAQRNRIGTNFHQLPVNQPKVPVNSYMMDGRSEEHTSELQSLMRISYAVFCLKKKNKKIRTDIAKYQRSQNIQ